MTACGQSEIIVGGDALGAPLERMIYKMKKIISILLSMFMIITATAVMAAGNVTYTFKGVNIITDGSPSDITDKALTEDITVTTSGDMNRKYVAITDIAHHKEAGTFPATNTFKPNGSYIYLGCANVNDNSIFTLNLPKIAAGSKVTITYAKPVVTNNGSTLRNTNDPYAYLKIADRYISINGDNFDTWRTVSVVTGEDTECIEFYADKWGAICISKIEIQEGKGESLHNINVTSTQYANLIVNGIKFCADENGKITLPSHPEGEKVTITAQKDGYAEAQKEITVGKEDINIDMPLTCETEAVYYESDFGNPKGTLDLDGEYTFADGIEAKDVTKVFGRVTFKDGGYLNINTARIEYKDGKIYLGDEAATPKDNMEFELYFDKGANRVFLKQNDWYTEIQNPDTAFDTIDKIEGKNATIEYIGISYPDRNKITIEGPDKVISRSYHTKYIVVADYQIPDEIPEFSVSDSDSDSFYMSPSLFQEHPMGQDLNVYPETQGKVTITATYNGATATKEVEIVKGGKLSDYKHDGNTLNLHTTQWFFVYDTKDQFGNDVMANLKDYKSSDESVIKIDQKGNMTAVGKGKATITANAYTGEDNIISQEYTVDSYYLCGKTEGEHTYVTGDLIDNENVTGYEVSVVDNDFNESRTSIEKTEIPAYTVKEDGMVVTTHYSDKELTSVESEKVKKGDKVLPSNGTKKVYFANKDKIEKIAESDTTTLGYDIVASEGGIGYIYEISPIYTFKNIGDCADGVTLGENFPDGTYDITFKKAETGRGDIFVNGYMVGNNVDQSDADRKVTDGAPYTAEDININNGKITVSMTDGSTMLDYVTVKKYVSGMVAPKYQMSDPYLPYMMRKPRIFIIGDSLSCNYYGDFEKEVGGGRTGWGQVLGNYVNMPVTNLANSGQYAKGLYDTAFPSVIENGHQEDICLIAVGYNDRSYSTRDEMINTVKAMISECRKKSIIPVLVTPNASQHDYKPSVSWASYLKDIAVDANCDIIDLSKLSYDYLYSLYGDNEDGEVTKNFNLTEVGGDNLHSSYAGANVWAAMVAKELDRIALNRMVYDGLATDYTYTFTDTLGREITATAK